MEGPKGCDIWTDESDDVETLIWWSVQRRLKRLVPAAASSKIILSGRVWFCFFTQGCSHITK